MEVITTLCLKVKVKLYKSCIEPVFSQLHKQLLGLRAYGG